MSYNYNDMSNKSSQNDANGPLFEAGGFESFGDGPGMMPPVQMSSAYVKPESTGKKVLGTIVGIIAVVLVLLGAAYIYMRPYLALNTLSKKSMNDTYTMTANMNLSGADLGSFDGMTIKGVKGKQVLFMDISSSAGGLMAIYSDVQNPTDMVIDIKPLFETLGKSLGSYGISYDKVAKSDAPLAFSAEQIVEIMGSNIVDVDQLQGYNQDLETAANFKDLMKYFKYKSNVESKYKVLGDNAYYFKVDLASIDENYKNANVDAYMAVDRNQFAAVVGVENIVTTMVYNYSFGPVEEPVMPDVSNNDKVLEYLKAMFR